MPDSNFSSGSPPVVSGSSQSTGVPDYPDFAPKAKGCWISILAVGLFLFLVLLVGGYAVYRAAAPKIEVLSEAEKQERFEAKYSSIEAAFSSEKKFSSKQNPEAAEIQTFFKKLSETVNYEITPELRKVIDYGRYAEEVRKFPELGNIAYFGNRILGEMLTQQVIGPTPFVDIDICRIEELGEAERLVYARTTGEYGDDLPHLFWIKRGKLGWKLFDWEHVRYGIRETEETAILIGDNNPATSAGYERYLDLYDEYSNEAENDLAQYGDTSNSPDDYESERKRVRRILKRSEELSFHYKLKPAFLYDIAFRYWINDDNQLALNLLSKIEQSKIPGVNYLRGIILHEEGNWEAAAKTLQEYHQRVGYDSETLSALASCFENLGNASEELKTRWTALRHGDSSSLERILAKQGEAAIAAIAEDSNLRDQLSGPLADMTGYMADEPIYEPELSAIVGVLKDSDEDSVEFHRAAANLAFVTGDFADGLNHITRTAAEDNDRYSLLYKACEFGQLLTVLRTSPTLADDFVEVCYLYEEDGIISRSQFQSALELVLKRLPNDPLANQRAGAMALSDGAYDDAIARLAKLLSAPGIEEQLDSYDLEYASELLVSAFYKAGNFERALQRAEENDDRFDHLLGLILGNKVAEQLEQLEELQSRSLPPESEQMVEGHIHLCRKEYSEAAKVFATDLAITLESSAWEGRSQMLSLLSATAQEGDILQAFRLCSHSTLFDDLANRFLSDRDLESATALVEECKRLLANPSTELSGSQRRKLETSSLRLRLNIHWLRKEYDALVNSIEDYLQATEASETRADSSVVERAIRAAMRTNQSSRVQQIARFATDDGNWLAAKAMLALVRRDFDKYRELNSGLYGNTSDLHFDPDFELTPAEIETATSRIRDLDQYGKHRCTSITIGASSAPKISVTSLEEWSDTRGLTLSTVSTEEHQPSWLIRGEQIQFAVKVEEATWEASDLPTGERENVESQTHQVALVAYGLDSTLVRQMAFELAYDLAPEDSVVLSIDYETGLWKACKEEFGKLTRGEIFLSQMNSIMGLELGYPELGDEVIEDADDSASAAKKQAEERLSFARAARNLLQTFPTVLSTSGAKELDTMDSPSPSKRDKDDLVLRAYCRLQLDPIEELLTVGIDQVNRESIYSTSYEGTLQQDSMLYPEFSKGDRVSVSEYMIERWELLDNEGAMVASGEMNYSGYY